MQYTLQVFEFEGHGKFRIIDRDGEPWFVLTEVCRELGIGNPSDAASRLDDDERDALGIADAIGRRQQTTIINESGLYNLILTSRVPGVKRFKKWITAEVLPSIRRTGMYVRPHKTPAFIRRYNHNWDRTSPGYFSVISELTIRVWGRLEKVGHQMADKAPDGTELRPDVSVGRRFAKWLRENYPDVCGEYTMYLHWTAAGEFEARQYRNELWSLFIEYVDSVWIPKHSEEYFKTRDAAALPYLPRLLHAPKRAA
jgi:hypothetical protein